VGHGRRPVHHGRVQVLAFPGGRLLRRDGGLLDLVAFPERLAAYLTHYNETRIKKSLDWMSPVQYRKHLGLAA